MAKKKSSKKKSMKKLKKLIEELKNNKFIINEKVNPSPDNRGWLDL